LDIFHQMAKMNMAIGVGQGGGNENPALGHAKGNDWVRSEQRWLHCETEL
jgi:hypothetical protein